MKILICTDGSPAAEEAAILVMRLGFPRDTSITLLGVSETEGEQVGLNGSMDRITVVLGGSQQVLYTYLRHGHQLKRSCVVQAGI
jgi:hypothetical protein